MHLCILGQFSTERVDLIETNVFFILPQIAAGEDNYFLQNKILKIKFFIVIFVKCNSLNFGMKNIFYKVSIYFHNGKILLLLDVFSN